MGHGFSGLPPEVNLSHNFVWLKSDSVDTHVIHTVINCQGLGHDKGLNRWNTVFSMNLRCVEISWNITECYVVFFPADVDCVQKRNFATLLQLVPFFPFLLLSNISWIFKWIFCNSPEVSYFLMKTRRIHVLCIMYFFSACRM